MKWESAWLNYKKKNSKENKEFLKVVYTELTGVVIKNAIAELSEAVKGAFDIDISVVKEARPNKGVILEKIDDISLNTEGYLIKSNSDNIIIKGQSEVGILYGVFHLIRIINQDKSLKDLDIKEIPKNPLRMLNHWDNPDGSIERGYSGNSFFFKNGEIIINKRTRDYARLVSSIGINAVVINNVNVKNEAIEFITDKYLPRLKDLSDIFNEYGIKLFLSVDFAAPIDIGGLSTADPLDMDVIEWWKKQSKIIYSNIPNFGGFLVKADSEGRPGPFTYNRTHADGANMLAKAIDIYNGIVIWRCFVYNCQQDWRDRKTDRARAGYDNFMPIDGEFDNNVILQIKNGPMDFQVREPVSPLFGGLKKTNQMLEVQIAQEYTGQQKHICYLIPMFKEILEFRTHCNDGLDTVADIVSGRTFNQNKCGFVAVANTGDDENWTGHDLAAANLYGFGRIAWNTNLSAEEIAEEWIKQTFSCDKEVVHHIRDILMSSWSVYEKYTSPLGIGWMVNPNHHFGPNVDGYEYDRWGTYHRADHNGVGVDRTSKGTGYSTQYIKENADMYENMETCPIELLLFFHYVKYNYELKNGKTLIQHIYDTHFEGVDEVEEMLIKWKKLEGKIDDKSYNRVRGRLEFQREHAKEWRDIINSYFYRKSMIEDIHGRKIY